MNVKIDMTPFVVALTDAIFADRRRPQRLKLGPVLHQRFQREAHAEPKAVHGAPILVGSVAGIPVVQRDAAGADVIRADGTAAPVNLPT